MRPLTPPAIVEPPVLHGLFFNSRVPVPNQPHTAFFLSRLRPILMTSFAFILGVLPLARAEGAGAEMRQSLGTAVFAGMLGVTFFGLLFTPTFYVLVRWLSSLLRRHAN